MLCATTLPGVSVTLQGDNVWVGLHLHKLFKLQSFKFLFYKMRLALKCLPVAKLSHSAVLFKDLVSSSPPSSLLLPSCLSLFPHEVFFFLSSFVCTCVQSEHKYTDFITIHVYNVKQVVQYGKVLSYNKFKSSFYY